MAWRVSSTVSGKAQVPVPGSTIPGEEAWPTQPVPLRPKPLARQTITEADLTNEAGARGRRLADQVNRLVTLGAKVIVSTLPERVSRWLHLDLGHRIERFGVPVSVVTADQAERIVSPEGGSG